MLKPMSVFLFVVMFISGTMHGQTLSKPPKPKESQAELKQLFSRETEKLKSESSVLDAKKMDQMRRQTPQKTWTTKYTLMVTLIVVVLVGLVAVIAYNSKRCIRREPRGCSFTDDIGCECLEYTK